MFTDIMPLHCHVLQTLCHLPEENPLSILTTVAQRLANLFFLRFLKEKTGCCGLIWRKFVEWKGPMLRKTPETVIGWYFFKLCTEYPSCNFIEFCYLLTFSCDIPGNSIPPWPCKCKVNPCSARNIDDSWCAQLRTLFFNSSPVTSFW